MNHKNKKTKHFFFIIFAFIVLSISVNAQGPNSPEAASFEPVDATDMVNLVTGDLSYVLPLLNVPSPEGGYPISLAYHAGIAMDQEASWVGLGWNINPGTINRNINGTPDDLAGMNYNEFFYDAGFTDNYYNFSIGATFYQVVSIGVGLSWGSNQSLGGYVSAGAGFEGTPFKISGHVGTNSVGINIEYGFNKNGGNYDNSFGFGINYNYDSGISGSLSLSNQEKKLSVGINFSSNGTKVCGSLAGGGIGNNNSTQAIDSGDYTYGVSTQGFEIDAGFFNIGYQKNSVKISLFKYDDIYTSGILYPFSTLLRKDFSNEIKENYFMDVNTLQRFSENDSHNDLIDNTIEFDKNNLIVPSYDNYVISAQGLSGTLSPYIFKELNLSPRGREEANNDSKYISYINDFSDGDTDKYYTFSSDYSSFLRLDKTNILNPITLSANGSNLLDAFKTNNNNIYSTIGLNVDNKKREGNAIKTFTNKEIRDSYVGYNGFLGISNIPGFVNARQSTSILNRQDTNIFLDKSIGAYQITALDGKTYHYSLPVYQFESFYKNFRNAEYNEAGEYENFLEIQKTTPYATHWLLTSITGPDYVDVNNDGRLDKNDFGYWVEFNYGKWSDGYIWQTPNGRNEEIINQKDPTQKTFAYSWGRKQIYYLDAIKTRTHTALFVKELRQDNKSIVGNEKNVHLFSNKYQTLYPYAPIYLLSNTQPYQIGFQPGYPGANTRARIGITRNISATGNNYLLKLKKIILIKNENIDSGYLNSIGNGLIQSQQLTFQCFQSYTDILFDGPGGVNTYGVGGNDGIRWGGQGVFRLWKKYPDPAAKIYDLHQQNNVLDIKDIEELDLESKALKVIEFNHDYSLAGGSPNGSPGKLTLKSVNFKGKGGNSFIPPYIFSYCNTSNAFNKNDIDDWGFHKSIPKIWSLNQIKMPTGGKINIDYESDSYYTEAASYETLTFDNINMTSPNYLVNITFNNTINLSNYFQVGREVSFSFKRKTKTLHGYASITDFNTKLKVESINGNTLSLYRLLDITLGLPSGNFVSQCAVNIGGYCYTDLKIKNNKLQFYTDSDLNGKKGGGIRTKSISTDNGIGGILKNKYLYTNSITNKISGITSYAPSKIEKGIPYASELPAPMVMYGEVAVIKENLNGIPIDKTVFEFETLSPQIFESGYIFNLGQSFRVKEDQSQSFQGDKVLANKFTIENRLGNLGRIKSIKNYNSQNQLLSIKVNSYKQNLDSDAEIGVTEETYKSYKVVKTNDVNKYYVNSTSRVNYPSVLQRSSITQGSYTNTTSFNTYDFLTGQVLETTSTSSDGKTFKTKIVPAYLKYSEMGSKVDNINNKNMLSQTAAQYSYILDNGIWKETGVGITTWNNVWSYKDIAGNTSNPVNEVGVWRKHKTYTWNGAVDPATGIFTNYNNTDDDGFVWGVGQPQTNTRWKQISEVTLYDHYSAPLEMKDINNNFASTKMGDKDTKVMATGNAGYNEIYYAGGENIDNTNTWLEPEVKGVGITRDVTKFHTGKYSIATTSNSQFGVDMKANQHRDGKYKLSVWVHNSTADKARFKSSASSVAVPFNGESVTAGEWTLKTHYFDVTMAATNPILCSVDMTPVYYDDLMIRPVASSIAGYVYNQWDELSYIIGNNGLATKFEYDNAGRLERTSIEVIDFGDGTPGGFKLKATNNINYKK